MISNGYLKGVNIVDFSLLIPGPLCSRMLVDLGASVMKVEPPKGDRLSNIMPAVYNWLLRGKELTSLDLFESADRARALEMCAGADVVLEGFRPGVVDRLGIGFADVSSVNPGVTYCSISGYGQDGSLRDSPGHDIAYQAAAGAYARVLGAGLSPERPPLPVADILGATFACTTICAALARKDQTEPTYLDVSMAEATAYCAVVRWGEYLTTGIPEDGLKGSPLAPANGPFQLRDGSWVVLAATEDKFWRILCETIDRKDLADAPYDLWNGRVGAQEDLDQQLATELKKRDSSPLLAELQTRGVPIMPIRTPNDVCHDPDFLARGLVVPTADGFIIDYPVRMDGARSFP